MPDDESRGHSDVSRRPRRSSVWIQDLPQSGRYKKSNHSKTYKVVSVAQRTSDRFEDSDHMRPLGIFSHLVNVCTPPIGDDQNWFQQLLTTIRYCLLHQIVFCPSSQFWKQCFSGLETANSLRERETGWNSVSHSIEPQQQEVLPSLASTRRVQGSTCSAFFQVKDECSLQNSRGSSQIPLPWYAR